MVKIYRERDRRVQGNFDQMMEDIGVRGYKRVQLVTSEMDGSGIIGDAFRRSQETVHIGGYPGQQGQEEGRGIDIEPKIEGRGRGRFCMEDVIREAPQNGGGLETQRRLGRPFQGHCIVSMAASDGLIDRNASAFAPILSCLMTRILRGWPNLGFREYGSAALR